jgi:hypothetical protein
MEIVKRESELQISITKKDFASFMDELGRWHGVIIDPITQGEFAKKMNGFLKCDFDYCLDYLLNNPKKYIPKPVEIYQLCRENKLRRLKEARLEEENREKNLPVNKEGREKVKQYLSRIGKYLNKKES